MCRWCLTCDSSELIPWYLSLWSGQSQDYWPPGSPLSCRRPHCYHPSQITNPSMLGWLFTIKERAWKVCFFTNTQPRFVSVGINGVLGPRCLAVHAWRFPYISEVPKGQGEVRFRALECSDVSSKSFSRAQHWYEGVRRNKRVQCTLECLLINPTKLQTHWWLGPKKF